MPRATIKMAGINQILNVERRNSWLLIIFLEQFSAAYSITVGDFDPPHAVSNNATEPVNREMPLSAYCSHLATKHLEGTDISVHVFMLTDANALRSAHFVCCHCRCANVLKRTSAQRLNAFAHSSFFDANDEL